MHIASDRHVDHERQPEHLDGHLRRLLLLGGGGAAGTGEGRRRIRGAGGDPIDLVAPLLRNAITLPPTLDGGRVGMPQSTRQGPYAASGSNQVAIGHHMNDVHSTRTAVNVDCVRLIVEKVYVPKDTTGSALSLLRDRAGLTIRDLATRGGYATASGVQRYLEPSFNGQLTVAVATKLADALAGLGEPPIDRDEVFRLAGFPTAPNASPFQMEGASMERMRDDLPVYGTALGASRRVDGEAIEQTTLNRAEVVQYARRPVLLNGNARAYGLFVSGSSMEPRHADGEIVLVDPRSRYRPGDDIVIYLRPNAAEDDDGERARAALVKRLRRRTGEFLELEQFTPALVFQIPVADIVDVHRVIPWSELIA